MPDEAENVVRDAPRPQEEQQGGRNPPLKFLSRGCGLNSLIIKPRANHELTRGQSAVATDEFPASPELRWDPTIAYELLPVVQREEDQACRPAGTAGNIRPVAPRDRHRFDVETERASDAPQLEASRSSSETYSKHDSKRRRNCAASRSVQCYQARCACQRHPASRTARPSLRSQRRADIRRLSANEPVLNYAVYAVYAISLPDTRGPTAH